MCPFPGTNALIARLERELDELPEYQVGHIAAGKLTVHSSPEIPHQLVVAILAGLLFEAKEHGWLVLFGPYAWFGSDLLRIDLSAWKNERWIPVRKDLTVAPDWVCEVLSPRTAQFDRATKLPIYAQAGVRHAWLIDPALRLLEVLRLREGKWQIESVFQNDDKVRAEPFEAIELDLALLWKDIPADPEAAGSDEEDAGAQRP